MRKWQVAALWFILGLILGILFFFLKNFSFSYNVTVVDLLTLLLTIVIAILFQIHAQRVAEVSKGEKELIFQEVLGSRTELRDVSKLFYECYRKKAVSNLERKQILQGLKNFGNSILLIDEVLKQCELSNIFQQLMLDLKRQNEDYRKVLTEKIHLTPPFDALSADEEVVVRKKIESLFIRMRLEVNKIR